MVEDIALYKICSQYLLRTHKGFAGLSFSLFSNANCSVYRNTPVIHTVIHTNIYTYRTTCQYHSYTRARAHIHARAIHTYIMIHTYILWSLQHYNISLTCLMCSKPAMCTHLCLCYVFLCACVYRRRLRDLYNLHRHGIQFQQYCIIVRRDLIGDNYSQNPTKQI